MRIEAVIICRNYSDFLAETLEQNLAHLDHVVVVSHWEDRHTQAVCARHSVECVQAHGWEEDGPFSKGRMINIGLAHLRRPEWILHIDADIALPGRFRHMLERAKLDRANIYGADRVNIYGWDRWQEIRAARRAHYSDRYFVSPPEGHPIGARIIHHEHGFCPIGYFQLWHASAGKRYPVGQGTAEHTDVLFAIQWSRQQRILLPEIFVYHLDSLAGPSPMGCNWGGRKTPIFGPAHHHQPGAPYTQKGC